MKHTTTFLLLLTIGLIGSFFITSCKKDVDKVYFVEYKYLNASQKSITIDDYRDGRLKSNELGPGITLIGRVDLFVGAETNVFAFPFSDSLLVTYDNSKFKWVREDTSNRNPLLLNNYETIFEKDKEDVYLFTFLESDFD
jgi:hypothetical protein